MKNKRTPFRQAPRNDDGSHGKRPENGVDRSKEASHGRTGADEFPEASADQYTPVPATTPAPRRRVITPPGGRANRGSVGRNGKPIAEAKPERLQKVLAQAGIGSRREMEEWIAAGRISVNGVTAHLGQGVIPTDKVKIGGRLVNMRFTTTKTPRVVIYHKPSWPTN